MDDKSPIQVAVDIFDGSPTKFATALGGAVKRQHVEHWLKTGRVPSDHCPDVERVTERRVRVEQLRPDVAWDVVRQGVA